jgi:hypothetical protein
VDPVFDAATEYRLAPAVVVSLAGLGLVTLASVVLPLSVVTAAAGSSFVVVGAVAALGVALLAAGVWWAIRRAYVVRIDHLGYQVRLVRGAGVKRARWVDVADAFTADIRGAACVVLSLRDGRTTTIPVAILRGDRDEFVTSLRARLHG